MSLDIFNDRIRGKIIIAKPKIFLKIRYCFFTLKSEAAVNLSIQAAFLFDHKLQPVVKQCKVGSGKPMPITVVYIFAYQYMNKIIVLTNQLIISVSTSLIK